MKMKLLKYKILQLLPGRVGKRYERKHAYLSEIDVGGGLLAEKNVNLCYTNAKEEMNI